MNRQIAIRKNLLFAWNFCLRVQIYRFKNNICLRQMSICLKGKPLLNIRQTFPYINSLIHANEYY